MPIKADAETGSGESAHDGNSGRRNPIPKK